MTGFYTTGDYEDKHLELVADFIEIYIIPLPNCEHFSVLRKVATQAFYDWFQKDDDEAIGTEIIWALEAAGYKENEDYRIFFYQDDDE